MKTICVAQIQISKNGLANADRILQHGLEDWLQLPRRCADDAQYLRRGFLPLQRLVALAGKARIVRLADRTGMTMGRGSVSSCALWRCTLWRPALPVLPPAFERPFITLALVEDEAS